MTRRQYWGQILLCGVWISFWYVSPLCGYLYLRNTPWSYVAVFAVVAYFMRQFSYLTVVSFEELGHVMWFNRKTGRDVDAGLYWTWKYLPILEGWNIHLGWSISLRRVIDFHSFAGNTNHFHHVNDVHARHLAISRGSFLEIATQRLIGRLLTRFFTFEDEERRIMYGKVALIGYWFICWPVAVFFSNFGEWNNSRTPVPEVSVQQPSPKQIPTQSSGPHKVRTSTPWPVEVPPKEYFIPGAGPYFANQIEYTLYDGKELFIGSSDKGCKLIPPGELFEFVLNRPLKSAVNMDEYVKTIIRNKPYQYHTWNELTQWKMADYTYRYSARALNVGGQGGVVCF